MAVDFQNAVKTEAGAEINGMIMQQVAEKCEGCERIIDFEGDKYCGSYSQPSVKWRLGNCNFATHVKGTAKAKTKVNPLKASKRATKGR